MPLDHGCRRECHRRMPGRERLMVGAIRPLAMRGELEHLREPCIKNLRAKQVHSEVRRLPFVEQAPVRVSGDRRTHLHGALPYHLPWFERRLDDVEMADQMAVERLVDRVYGKRRRTAAERKEN